MVQVFISNKAVSVKEGSLRLSRQIKQRSSCDFEVIETQAPYTHYIDGQSVVVQTTDGKRLFSGYLASAEESLDGTVMSHRLRCTDKHYILDKRLGTGAYKNALSGDIVGDIYNQYLKEEGILAEYVYRKEFWNSGTLTNVTFNASDGSLQLKPAGQELAYTASFIDHHNTTVDPNGSLVLLPQTAMKYVASNQNTASIPNCYIYRKIWTGSYKIVTGDKLVYDIWINPSNPQIFGGLDGVASDGSSIKSFNSQGIKDQNGIAAHPGTDLKGRADGRWYNRIIDLSAMNNKTIQYFTVVQEGDNTGEYTFFVKNAFIVNGTTTKVTIFNGSFQTNGPVVSSTGYESDELTTQQVYHGQGYAVSAPLPLDAVGLWREGIANYVATANIGNVKIIASLDNWATWEELKPASPPSQEQTTLFVSAPLSLLPGIQTAGKTLRFRVDLQGFELNPTLSPTLYQCSGTISPSFQPNSPYATVSKAWGPSNFLETGTTQDDLELGPDGLKINGYVRNWDDGVFTGQTTYGAGVPQQGTETGYYWLQCAVNNETRCRLDFAGQVQNFVLQVDFRMDQNSNHGIVYRAQNWGNPDGGWAYAVEVSPSKVELKRGTNTAAGGSQTSLVVFNTTLETNTWHTLRVAARFGEHKVYINDALVIERTDTQFQGAGYFGLRNRNTTSSIYKLYFDNLSIIRNGDGWWESQEITLPTQIADSRVDYEAVTTQEATIALNASYDGGTTYLPVLDGQPLPQAATRQKVKFRADLTAYTSVTPIFKGLSFSAVPPYRSEGNRLSPPLDLSPAVEAANSNIFWEAKQPIGTDLKIEASLDNGASWVTLQNDQPIPGLYHAPNPYLDLFDHDTRNQYQITGLWQWNTTDKYVTSSGSGKLLYTDFFVKSAYIEADLEQPGGGLLLNVYDIGGGNSNYYSAEFTATKWEVYKLSYGNRYTLAGPGPISFEEPHRVRLVNEDNIVKLFIDGVEVGGHNETGEFPHPAGRAGLVSTTGGLRVSTVRIQPIGEKLNGKKLLLRQTLSTNTPKETPRIFSLTTGMRSPKIDAGVRIPEVALNFQTITAAFDQLADQSNYWYNVDEAGQLWFKQYNALAAPYVATSSLFLRDVQVTNTNPKYRNRQFAFTKNTTLPQTYTGRGGQKTWTVAYPIAEVPTVKVNGIIQSIGIRGVDTDKAFYWSKNDPVVSADDKTATTFPDIITIEYTGLYNFIYQAEDISEIITRKKLEGGGTTGYVEEIESLETATEDAAIFYANALLQQYSGEGHSISFAIPPDSLKSGGLLKEGQLIRVKLSEHDINHDFLIESIDLQISGCHYWYAVKAAYGASSDNWVKFFDKLLHPKTQDVSTAGQGTIIQIVGNFIVEHGWTEGLEVTELAALFPDTSLLPSVTLLPIG